MAESRPAATAVAVLFLIAMLACLAGRFVASERAAGSSGPTHLATGGGAVFVHAAGELYRLTATGSLLARVPLDRLGLADEPIDLRVLADGRLLIALQRPARLVVCVPETWACARRPFAQGPGPERQLKVWPNDGDDGLLYTDSRGDGLWALPEPGASARPLLGPHVLAGPNDLLLDGAGSLWVADTDHRRIVELVQKPGQVWVTGRTYATSNAYTRAARHFPIMLAQAADGSLWVTQASEESASLADVLVYDPDAGPVARIELPDGQFAADVAALEDSVLITDLVAYRVDRVDVATRAVTRFGDGAFVQALSGLEARRARYDLLGTLALIGVFVCAAVMIGAAVIATPRERRWTPAAAALDPDRAAKKVPAVRGIHWLERDPALERTLKWMEYSGLAFVALLVVAAGATFYWLQGAGAALDPEQRQALVGEAVRLLGLVLVLSGVLAVVLKLVSRPLRARLGTDGRMLRVRLHDGRELTAAPADLRWTPRLLLFPGLAVPLQGGRQQRLYAAGELETWVVPLLRDATRVSEWEAFRHQLRAGRSTGLWLLALVLLAALGAFGVDALTASSGALP